MRRFHSRGLQHNLLQYIFLPALAVTFLCSLAGCGGSRPPGPSQIPAKITLNPSTSISLQIGNTLTFSASAQNGSNSNINLTYSFQSSDTSILNIAPNGVACAGRWDAAFTTCTPEGTGVVQVTASAQGASSSPTFVFVHPPIDYITVTGILPTNQTLQEPCLSQGQTMTVQAKAFSQGADVTASVGPFTWSADNLSVVKLTPLLNPAYNLATNQATATANTPGIAQIYASASGVASNSFQQPQYTNTQGTSPVLNFFETCPVQNIALELGPAGSQQTGQTSFVTAKGTAQTITAIITDVMGNTSLENPNSITVLKNIPLTWTASQPAVVATGTSCTQSCSASTPSPGAGSITASCSPPTCNVGFPQSPAILSSPACAQFFHLASCQQFIPLPVYATTAISGVVTGAPSPNSFIATSLGCSAETPEACNTSLYSMSTGKAVTNNPNPLPAQPNSFLFDLAGDKVFMGGAYGALIINPTNLGSQTSAFSALGSVTGKILASSTNGNFAVFSDTLHTPNQVYIVNATNSTAPTATALNITGAVTAAFSPDGLKAFIIANGGNSLYIYSTLQALQGPIVLAGPANTVAFSSNGAFAFVGEDSFGSNPANLTAFNMCDNQTAGTPVSLLSNPISIAVLPGVHFEGKDSYGNAIPDGTHTLVLDSTGIDIVTASISAQTLTATQPLCQSLAFVSGDPVRPAQRIELDQGTIHPINVFASADGTLLYVVASDRNSILVYDFSTRGISGIQLLNNATPVSADMTADASTILIAGSDGMLHEVSTAAGGADQVQLQFANLPNFQNAFCTLDPAAGPCTLNFVAAKP